jgi:PAS domain S-box-containing protein
MADLPPPDLLLDQLPLAVALLDRDLRYRRVNGALAALNGLPAAAHLGRTVAEVIPERAAAIEPLLRQVLATGEPVVDLRLSAPAGDWLATLFPARGPTGELDGVGIMVAEVTPFTRAEAALRQEATLRERAHDAALRDREAQLELALDVAGLGTWRHDLATGTVALDARARAHYGLEAATAELPLDDLLARLHPEDAARTAAELRAALDPAGPGRYNTEYRVARPDGSVHWLAIHVRVEFAGASRRAAVRYGTTQEITARKADEAALRAAAARAEAHARAAVEHCARLESLLAHVPLGIALMDTELRYQHVNAHLAAINGLPRAAHLGRTLRDLLPALADVADPLQRAVLATGQPQVDQEIVGETPADPGRTRTWRASYFPVHTGTTLIGAGVVVTDITEQRQAEQALHAEHQRLQTILTTLDEGVVALNPDGTVALANPAARRTLGVAAPESVAPDNAPLPRLTLYGPDGLPLAPQMTPAALVLGGATLSGAEYEGRVAGDPAPRWFRASGAPVHGPDGRLALAVFTGRDITEEKRNAALLAAHAEGLNRTNAELARALRLKDEFLAMMSHELRTPLSAVLGMAEALEDGVYGPVGERQRPALAQIGRNGRQLLDILSDILDLARITAGTAVLAEEPVEIDGMCEAALRTVADRAREKGLALGHDLPAGLGALRGDGRRLMQVLVNLLDNAVKFTPPGGRVGLEVRADPGREQVAFVVWDTGVGIAPADMDRLFQPFTQVDGRLARAHEGIGLGLTLARRIAELHGGGVEVASRPGVGSRFTVTLPWRPDGEPPQPAGPDLTSARRS